MFIEGPRCSQINVLKTQSVEPTITGVETGRRINKRSNREPDEKGPGWWGKEYYIAIIKRE